MDIALIIGADLLAIGVLVFGIYFPRHRRRDLVVAFLGVNVGVLAVALVLGSTTVGAGLGLGLFGVLSIIRLRSREIEQGEVAYYFAALAIGLIGGLGGFSWVSASLMALIVVAIFVADHPALFRRYRQQTIVIDHAVLDESELRGEVERLLGARVHALTVVSLDLVNDTTTVDARFELLRVGRPASGIRAENPAHVALETVR